MQVSVDSEPRGPRFGSVLSRVARHVERALCSPKNYSNVSVLFCFQFCADADHLKIKTHEFKLVLYCMHVLGRLLFLKISLDGRRDKTGTV